MIEAIAQRLGRRGMVLALFSLVFLMTGMKALLDPSMDDGRFMFYATFPAWLRGLIWLVPALLGFMASLRTKRQNDAFGFSALTIPSAILMVSYFVSWLGYLIGLTHYGTGWVSCIQWGLILTLLLVTSGWTEVKHETVIVRPTEEDDG